MIKIMSVVLILAMFPAPALAGWFSFAPPKTAREAVERVFSKNAKIIETDSAVEMTLMDKRGLNPLSYSDVARAVMAYGEFMKSKGKKIKTVTVWHFSNVTYDDGNTYKLRTGSLKWSSEIMNRFNYKTGDWYKFISQARINDMLAPGFVSLKGLCGKSYASLYRPFCMRFKRKSWQR